MRVDEEEMEEAEAATSNTTKGNGNDRHRRDGIRNKKEMLNDPVD